MSISNTKVFPKHFDRNIAKIFLDDQMAPDEYSRIFQVMDAPAGRDFTEAQLSGLGELLALEEGQIPDFDMPAEGNEKQRTFTQFGRGFYVTYQMWKDDLFKNFEKLPRALSKSARYTIEKTCWDVLNDGFTTSVGWDGNPLFYDSHATLKSGDTLDNEGLADLSTTSLQAAFEYFEGHVNTVGFPDPIRPKILVIPYQLAWVANDILKATGRVWDYNRMNSGDVGTGSGAGLAGFPAAQSMNLMNPKNGIVDDWSIFVSHYLDDADSWFVLGEGYDLRCMFKERIRMQSYDDFYTDSKLFKATTRFAAFSNDFEKAYGAAGV